MGNQLTEDLLRLRDISNRTGILCDSQIFQLKLWASILSPHKGSFEISVDQEDKVVTFSFSPTDTEITKPAQTGLSNSVKWLLGGEWLVNIYLDSKIIFKGRAKKGVQRLELPEKPQMWRDRLKYHE